MWCDGFDVRVSTVEAARHACAERQRRITGTSDPHASVSRAGDQHQSEAPVHDLRAKLDAIRLLRASGTEPRPEHLRATRPSLGVLLHQYFEYMVSLTDSADSGHTISLHEQPRFMDCGDCSCTTSYRFPRELWKGKQKVVKEAISIEDPFETVGSVKPHELASSLTSQTAVLLRSEYCRAASLLRETVDTHEITDELALPSSSKLLDELLSPRL